MKSKILFSILIVCFSPLNSSGAIYYIVKNGNDKDAGTLSQPWQTIEKANSMLAAGDTVFIRAGAYNETISPYHSGTPGNYITYKGYNDEIVTIIGAYYGVELDNKSYVIVDGIHIINTEYKFVSITNGAHHNTVQDCYMEGAGRGWGSVYIKGSSYNKILNNTIKFGEVAGQSDVVYIEKESCYNLVQGNEIDGRNCGHASLSIRGFKGDAIMAGYNIIKNNVIHAGSDDNVNISQWTEHNFIDGNIIYDCGTLNDNPGAGYKNCGGFFNVGRNNIIYDNRAYGLGIYCNYYNGSSPEANGNLFYNNVCYDNGGGGGNMHAGLQLVVYTDGLPLHHTTILNNIFYKNFKEIYSTVQGGDKSKYYDNIFQTNNIFHNNPDDKTIQYFGTQYSLTQMETNYPAEFNHNLELEPLFVDPGNYDFHLLPNSPMIDAGIPLTYTKAPGNGKQISVENATFFCDGFDLIEGDLIQLEGEIEKARVIQVDYDHNILTIDRALSWSVGQGISLPYNGSAPDIGAYEYGDVNSLSAKIDASPTSGYVPLTVNFTGKTTGGTPPYNYNWDFGDNVSSSEQNPTHTYSMAQSYTPTLTVTDSKRKKDNVSVVINAFNDKTSGYLIHNTFEKENEGWGAAIGNTAYETDNFASYTGNYSMHVYATSAGSKLSIGVKPPGWDINQYPFLSLAYKIPNNVPVGIFFNTDAGWICLGGSENYNSGSYPANDAYRLTDDGSWHVIKFNVKEKIREVYPSANTVIEFEWYTQSNAEQGDEFWFDEVMVFADENVPPKASIRLSDPSPTKAGTVEVTLTTSKSIINVPTPLAFMEADNSITYIELSGVVPGSKFTGIFIVDETVAEGGGYFSLPGDILVDENNNKGNEITTGAYVKIYRTAPAKPKNLQGNFLN